MPITALGLLTGRALEGYAATMFFRLKTTRCVQVLRLIESYRDEAARPRHLAVTSLGNAPIERADWKPIAKAAEDRLYGREVLLERPLNETQTEWVDLLVRKVGSEGRTNRSATTVRKSSWAWCSTGMGSGN